MPTCRTRTDLLTRWRRNPLITLNDVPFRCNTVFNGTPVKVDGEYYLILRIEGQQGYSFFALARSRDGLHFEIEKHPCMLPAKDPPWDICEEKGIEDPRLTEIDGVQCNPVYVTGIVDDYKIMYLRADSGLPYMIQSPKLETMTSYTDQQIGFTLSLQPTNRPLPATNKDGPYRFDLVKAFHEPQQPSAFALFKVTSPGKQHPSPCAP